MSEAERNEAAQPDPQRSLPPEPGVVTPEEFKRAFGETLDQTLDLATWRSGVDLQEVYDRLETEVITAAHEEERTHAGLREFVFPRLRERPNAPPQAGVWSV